MLTIVPDGFLQGFAFVDANGNNSYDRGVDAPKPGATIKLLSSDGSTVLDTRTTGADGYYLFDNLAPGTYRLSEVAAGYTTAGVEIRNAVNPASSLGTSVQVQVVDATAETITAKRLPGPLSTLVSAGFTVTGGPFNSFTADGDTIQQFKTRLTGGTLNTTREVYTFCVDLYHAFIENATFSTRPSIDPTAPTGVTTYNSKKLAYLYNTYGTQLITDPVQAGGLQLAIWELLYDQNADLASGNFKVYPAYTPVNVIASAQSYLGLATGEQRAYTLSVDPFYPSGSPLNVQGQITTEFYNFRNVAIAEGSLSGFVYHDGNDDGTYQVGTETPIGGVRLILTGTDSGGSPVGPRETFTAADGSYDFDDLPSGTYAIAETQPVGYIDGLDARGGSVLPGSASSDIVGSITVLGGADSPNNNFGESKLVSIAGSVYVDKDAGGTLNAGDLGIGGASVVLEGIDFRGRTVRRTARTESDGSYRFDQLWAGTYTLTEAQPAGYLDGADSPGTAGGTAQDDRFAAIPLHSGVLATGYDFGEHRAPVFVSRPIEDTPAEEAYSYDADAVDPDGDTLAYSLLDAPAGMTIASATGVLGWSPTASDIGDHVVVVRADDGRGGVAEQRYILTVFGSQPNRPPRFTSDPVVDATVDVPYSYPATAFDPDLDPLTFSLYSGPDGMTVGTGGLVQWTPPASLFTQDQVSGSGAAGTDAVAVDVVLDVSDGRGGTDRQAYTILVRPRPDREPNRPPIIVSTPPTEHRRPPALTGSQWLLPATIHDFRAEHGDFEDLTTGVVTNLLQSTLGTDRRPVFAGPDGAGQITSAATFDQWYRDVPGVNMTWNLPLVLTETSAGSGVYRYRDDTFFPIDNALFGNEGDAYRDASNIPHNFHFTMEIHAGFTYVPGAGGGQVFTFRGDDDLWVYVNDQLVIDLGGVHEPAVQSFNLDVLASTLGLVAGQEYPIDVFYAERHTNAAWFQIETNAILTPYRPYSYDVEAIDPDDDPVAYALLSPYPAGMTIDAATGRIEWAPSAAQVGTHTVKVRATDGRGGVDIQEYTLTVNPATGNAAPRFEPDVALLEHRVNLGESYAFTARAVDDDGDPLTFSLMSGPAGLLLDPITGEIRWTPTAGQAGGTFDAWLQVSDGRGGVDALQIEIQAVRLVSHDPIFDTSPILSGRASWLYSYDADASDVDGDPIEYDLPVSPPGMVVHPRTGLVVWVPRADQVGTHDVILRARDSQGGVKLQPYRVVVTPANRAPQFTSTPPFPAYAALAYRYQVTAKDLDGDTLSYTFDGTPPTGMTIGSGTGLLEWTTPTLGTHPIRIKVGDDFGGSAIQAFDLQVVADPGNRDPEIVSQARTMIRAGRQYLYRVRAEDEDNDPLTYGLQTPPGDMAYVAGAPGLIAWTPTVAELGSRTFTVTVSDGRGGSDSQLVTVEVVSQDVNGDPTITSTPVASAVAGQTYRYQLGGVDPDNDPILWGLDGTPPDGMTIDTETGLLTWTPRTDQVGEHTIRVRARDHLGGVSAPQEYTLRVRGANIPPRIVSTPPTQARRTTPYAYDVDAVDPEDDALTYSLVSPFPSGMTIDAATGRIEWTPGSTDALGPYDVTVRVTDDFGGADDQTYTIVLAASLPNRPPQITSDPRRFTPTGAVYQYAIAATDPEGQAITYSVVAPAWLSYDSITQRVQGTPPTAGTYTVTVKATDSAGAWSTQTYTLTARANAAPTIAAMPARQVIAGATLRYDVPASDPDGDPLTFALTTPPDGLSIDARGRITWAPTAAQVSATPYIIRVTATDAYGASSGQQTFNLTVVADTTTPVVDLVMSATEVEEGQRVTFLVAATDDVGVASLSLTVDGQAVALDGHGAATLTMPTNGTFAVVATAKDAAGNAGTAGATLYVLDPDNLAPVVFLTGPAAGAVITAVTAIRGNISDDAYPLTYTLTATPLGGGPTRMLAQDVSVTSAITDGFLADFDPTILANGSYTIRLEATDSGHRKSHAEMIVSVAGDLKLGNFRVSFTDLQIPVAGIPITVSRTYDSLYAHEDGDLGHGWRLDFGDMEVKVSSPDSSLGAFGDQIPFRNGTRVTITGPDGVPQGFTFAPLPYGALGLTLGYYINFVPDPGVTGALVVPRQTEILLTKVGSEYISLEMGGIPYNPADPAFGGTYDLIGYDGLRHTIDSGTGELLAMSDRLGNTLRFEYDGIVSDTGRRVDFERDPATGRITALVDPRGHKVRYGYDANGDLVSVIDRLNNPPVQFVYDPARPHYLAEIRDPLDRPALQVQYDVDGRVDTLTDADGKSLSHDFDPITRTQTVTENDGGASTTVAFDDRGDVTRVEDSEGGVIVMTYEDRYLKSRTRIVGQNDSQSSETDDLTTTYMPDERGKVLNYTDPAGRTTYYTYDAFGQPATITGPGGQTTRNSYDPETGNLVFSSDPAGSGTSFEYDERGLLLKVTLNLDGVGWASGGWGSGRPGDPLPTPTVDTTFDYDQFGDIVAITDSKGVVQTFTHDENGNATGGSQEWVDPAGTPGRRVVRSVHVYDFNDQLTDVAQVTEIYDAGDTLVDSISVPQSTTDYDGLGRAWRTSNALGMTSETTFDARGLAIRSLDRDPSGDIRSVRHTVYDAQGRVIFVDDPHLPGRDASGEIDYGASPAQPGQPANGTETVYDDLGRVVETRRWADVVITLDESGVSPVSSLADQGVLLASSETQYDAAGRAWRSIRRTYDAGGGLADVVATEYEFDASGLTTAVVVKVDFGLPTEQVASRTEYEYDAAGRTVLVVDPLQRQTRTQYDAAGRPIKTTYHDGTYSLTAYDARGLRIAETDQAGITTENEYDEFGNLVAVVQPGVPDGSVSGNPIVRPRYEYEYDDYGNLALIRDPLGRETTFTHDEQGRRLSLALPLAQSNPGRFVEFTEFDDLGRTARHVDFEGNATAYTYDDLGRLATESFYAADAAAFAGTDATTQGSWAGTYGADGHNVVGNDADYPSYATVSASGHSTFTWASSTSDPRALLKAVPAGTTDRIASTWYSDTAFTIDVALTDGQAHQLTLYAVDWDNLGRSQRVDVLDADSGTLLDSRTLSSFSGGVYASWTLTGHVQLRITRLAGQNAVVSGLFFDDATAVIAPEATVTYGYDTYDTEGRHDTVVDSRYGTVEQVYDREGRLIRRTTPEGTIRYEYDPATGNKTRMFTDNTDVRYGYDPLGRLETVAAHELNNTVLGTPLTTTYTYDDAGQLVATALPDGTTETREYDDLGRLTLVEHAGPSGTLAHFTYTLDPSGHRTAVDESGGRRVEYTYDDLYRLTQEVIKVNGAVTRTLSYTYDLVGNRLTRYDSGGGVHATNLTYTYDDNDRLVEYEGDRGQLASYTYDDNGSMLTEYDEFESQDATYTWDLAGRLLGMTDGGQTYSFEYDPDGMRVGSSVGVQQTTYLIDKQRAYDEVLEEYAPGGALAATYVQGLDLLFQDRAGVRSFFRADGLGSVRALTDSSGSVTDTYTYDAFGRELGRTGTTANSYQFAGEQFDAGLDQYYLRARYYDAAAGRFTMRDPLDGDPREPLQLNRYLYTSNNPVDRTDPGGMDWSLNTTLQVAALNGALTALTCGAILGTVSYNGASDPTHRPDGFMVTGSYGYAGRGFQGGGSAALYFDFRTASLNFFLTAEVGTAPLSTFKKHRGASWGLSFGVTWNTNSPGDLSGFSFTATLPVWVLARISKFRNGVTNQGDWITFMMELAQYAKGKNIVNHRFGSLSLTQSYGNGAVVTSYGLKNYNYSVTVGHSWGPLTLFALPDPIREWTSRVAGNIPRSSDAFDSPEKIANVINRINDDKGLS